MHLAALTIGALSPARADDGQIARGESCRRNPRLHALIYAGGGSAKDLALYHRSRGIRHRANNDYYRAISDFDAAIKLDPTLATAYGQRGATFYPSATIIARSRMPMRRCDSPELDQPHVTRGTPSAARVTCERALSDYSAAINKNAGNVSALYYRGITLRDKGEHDRALADFDAR